MSGDTRVSTFYGVFKLMRDNMKKRYEFWEKLSLKCVLIGDTGVGKSSLAARVSNRSFKTDYTPTLFDNYAGKLSLCLETIPFCV